MIDDGKQRVMLTSFLRSVLKEQKDDPKIEEMVGEGLSKGIKYIQQMPRGDARIKHLYKDMDKAVELQMEERAKDKKELPISCKRGCAHCCHLYVVCTHEEADLIYKEAKKRNIPLSKKRLEYQSRFKNPGDYFTRFGKRTRCVFLDDKNDCMIYEYRPMSCRKYFAISPPETCLPDKDGKVQNVGSPVNISVELLASAHMNMDLIEGMAKEGDNFSLSARMLERVKRE